MTTQTTEQKKVMVDPNYTHRSNRQRIADDEKELAELEKQMREGTEEPVEEEPVEEEPVEEEPAKEEPAKEEPTEEEPAEEEPSSSEEKTFKKRFGDLRRHMAKKEKEWEEKFEKLMNTDDSFVAPKSDEDLDSWIKQYPDVAGYVDKIAEKKAEALLKATNDRFEEFDKITSDTRLAKAELAIRTVHKDYDKLKKDDAFHDWLETQPKMLQDAIYEQTEDSASAIRVIDLYKVDKGLTKEDVKAKAKNAAASVETKASSPNLDKELESKKILESDVAKMSDAEFEKNFDAINEAQRTGNFVYNVTKRK